MWNPEDITEQSYRGIAVVLLQQQAQYTAEYIVEETRRWSADFISDDGTDYVRGACEAVTTLTHIRYEGDADELRNFLFDSEDSVIDIASDGLCPTLARYADRAWDTHSI